MYCSCNLFFAQLLCIIASVGSSANGNDDDNRFNNPYGVAISPDGVNVYVANYGDNSVSVISTATNNVTATVPVGTHPHGLAVSPDGAYVYVANYGNNSVSVISTATNTVTRTITDNLYRLSSPDRVAVAPNGAYVYVTTSYGSVSVISTATNNVTATMGSSSQLGGLAVSPDGAYVYATNIVYYMGSYREYVSVISTATNNVTATVLIGTYTPTGAPSYRMVVSPDGAYVYVTIGSGSVSVISTATNNVTATIRGFNHPEDIAMSPNGAYVYVTNYGNSSVSIISTATNTPASTITVESLPEGVAASPNGAYVYVANYGNSSVSMINLIPVVNVSPSSWTMDIGQVQVFTATVSGGSGSYTGYQWYVDGVAQNGQTSQTFSYSSSSPGSISITATATDIAGATSPQSNVASVTVNSATTPTPTTTPTSTPTQAPTSTPTPYPTTAPPTSTPKPTPSSTPVSTKTPTPTSTSIIAPSKTPQPIASPTLEPSTSLSPKNNSFSPLIRSLDVMPITLLGSPSVNTAKIATTTTTVTGIVAISCIVAFASTGLNLAVPFKKTQDLKEAFEELLKFRNAKFKKTALITKKEIAVLATTILFTGLILDYIFLDGVPNVLNPSLFVEFFFFGLMSACIVQFTSFFSDVYCSMDSKVQKELKLWTIGGIMYFASGILKFPFSSISVTKTSGSTKYETIEQKQFNATATVVRILMLSLLAIPFAFMSISNIDGLVVVGSAGVLTVLIILCVSLIPISPLPGKDIFEYKEKLSITFVILLVVLLILYYLGFLTFWSYITLGVTSAVLLPFMIIKLKSERAKLKQVHIDLWFKR